MRIDAIPRVLLPHSVILTEITKDEWQKEIEGEEIELTHVRIEPSRDVVLSRQNTEQRLKAVLFFDAVNSEPQGLEWREGDKVTHGTIEYHIASIEELYALGDAPHHWEIGLI